MARWTSPLRGGSRRAVFAARQRAAAPLALPAPLTPPAPPAPPGQIPRKVVRRGRYALDSQWCPLPERPPKGAPGRFRKKWYAQAGTPSILYSVCCKNMVGKEPTCRKTIYFWTRYAQAGTPSILYDVCGQNGHKKGARADSAKGGTPNPVRPRSSIVIVARTCSEKCVF